MLTFKHSQLVDTCNAGAGAQLGLVTALTLKVHLFVPDYTVLRASFDLQDAQSVLQFWAVHKLEYLSPTRALSPLL